MPRAATSSRIRGLVSASRSAAQAYCQSPAGCISSWPGWHMSSTVRPGRQAGEHGREIGLVEPAAEVEAYEIVAAPQAFQRRRGAEEVERRLLRDARHMPQAAQHVAAHALGRIADGTDAVLRRELGNDARDTGQHVHVLVPVDVADGDAGIPNAAQLRAELEANFGERDPAAQPPCREAASSAAGNGHRARRGSRQPRRRRAAAAP